MIAGSENQEVTSNDSRWPSPVPPGTGWPEDPACPTTPIARDRAEVVRLASKATELEELDARVSVCRACPRLVAWREAVAKDKRRAFATEPYWGRPIAGWGEPAPRVLIVGLAPAAHGGNRTGRIFTGDRSGDWLFASLHRVGLAEKATSLHAGDGQRLIGARMVAAVRCAPPGNKPTPEERDTCASWLDRELELVRPSLRVAVALGAFAWDSVIRSLGRIDALVVSPRPSFGHGVQARIGDVTVLGCYHPSQQNTFTGKLTEKMLDDVLSQAESLSRAARVP